VAGGVYVYGKQMLETPGPLPEEKIVNIPRAARRQGISPKSCSAKV